MLCHKDLIGQDRVSLLCQGIDEFFIEGAGWEKMHREAFSAIDVGRFILTLNCELGYEHLGAVGALNSVVRLVLREQAK